MEKRSPISRKVKSQYQPPFFASTSSPHNRHLPLPDQSIQSPKKRLETVVKPGHKEATQLIKSDQEEELKKVDLVDDTSQIDKLKMKDDSPDDIVYKIITNYTTTSANETSVGYKPNPSDSNNKGAPKLGSAKSRLHEFCAANHWNPPVFECWKEEGPNHLKLFTFKVLIDIREPTNSPLECIGNPQSTKKTAAEDAAEGALWYLKHTGYQPKHRRRRKNSCG